MSPGPYINSPRQIVPLQPGELPSLRSQADPMRGVELHGVPRRGCYLWGAPTITSSATRSTYSLLPLASLDKKPLCKSSMCVAAMSSSAPPLSHPNGVQHTPAPPLAQRRNHHHSLQSRGGTAQC